MIIDYGDWFEAQDEIAWSILDAMPREEREQYFRDRGLSADGLPLPVELVEGADLLKTIDGRSACPE